MQRHFAELYKRHSPTLEDFWLRRERTLDYAKEYRVFGLPLHVQSNDEQLFEAMAIALRAYSTASNVDAPTLTIQAVVRSADWQPGPPPRDLYPQNLFVGDGDWLMIQLGAWGHAHVDLGALTATLVLTPELTAKPDIVARGVLNTILTNLLTSAGFAMLHCTGLLRNGHAVLLMAPHNSGKSTTALRLTLGGFQLISDSQIYISPFHDGIALLGFPVGRARLRRDMLPHFPQLHDFLRPEAVRDEMKFSFDLRDFDKTLVYEEALTVNTVDLCLLTRSGTADTSLTPTTHEAVWNAVMQNSIFYDTEAAWMKNLAAVTPLIERVRPFDLQIGSEAAQLVTTVETLISERKEK